MTEIYRNVYFMKEPFFKGRGSREIYYSGKAKGFVTGVKDFLKEFDQKKDLLITCSECAKKEIKFISKIERNSTALRISSSKTQTTQDNQHITNKRNCIYC